MTIRRRPTLEVGLVGLAGLCALFPLPPAAVEQWYSTAAYPAIQRAITPLSNRVPIAVLDVLILGVLAAIAVTVVRGARAARQERRAWPLVRAAGRLGVGLAAGYLVFLMLWGFNYRRMPMADRLLAKPAAPSSEEVVQLGVEAVARMNALHEAAHRAGWPQEEWHDPALREAFRAVQRMLTDAPLAEPGRLKPTMLGHYFRWTGVDGMVNPFALEVLANPDLLPFERPFVAAHEWSHLAGYADEAEANFVGWLTCIRASVPIQYSGWLYLYWQLIGEVSHDDRMRLDRGLAEGPRADIAAIVSRLRRAQLPWLRNAGWAVYNQYLKANRVEAGIRSYGAVVTLILQARFEDDWRPVRRDAAPAPRRRG